MSDAGQDSYAELDDLYAGLVSVVRRSGRCYPSGTDSISSSGLNGLVVADSKPLEVDEELLKGGGGHLSALRESRPVLFDGPVLGLKCIENDLIYAGPGTYFDAVCTSDALRGEYQESGVGPLRKRAHSCAGGDPIRSGTGRVAAIGVTVVVTVETTSWPLALVGQRRADLASDPGLWDVGPSGTLEPDEFQDPLEASAFRELEEELGQRDRSRSRLSILGLGYDLLRLRPEVVLHLQLDQRKQDREFPALSQKEYSRSRLLSLDPDTMASFWRDCHPESVTPSGAAALALLEDL